MSLSCRFYENKFPNVGDIVIAKVESIQDMGAYVRLLEYNNIEGMIPHSELSRRRIRSIQKLIRVGRNEAVVVLRVDSNKGYIDLSKRRANATDMIQAEEKYLRAKLVNQIIRNVAETLSIEVENLYEETAWKLQKIHGDAYDSFKLATIKPTILDECNLDDNVKELLINKIVHHLKNHPQKIRADIEVTCYHFEGVDAIKKALKAGIAVSTEAIKIDVTLTAPPIYYVHAMSSEIENAIALMNKAIDTIKTTIEDFKGTCVIKMPPRVTTEKEKEVVEETEDEEEDDDLQ